jgi:hypothetical protein
MAVVSAVYFFADRRRPAYRFRLLCSAHGIAGIALYFGALALWAVSPTYRGPLAGWGYLILYLVPISLVVIALLRFRGPWLVHLLQVPNVCALIWAAFVGGMAVTGDWL